MIGRVEGLNFVSASSSRRAVDMLRMLSFDFVLVNIRLPDIGTWDFLRHLKTGFPGQKWALVGGPITEQQEITARMFGATTLFDATPSSHELLSMASRIREKAIQNVINGNFGQPGRQPAPVRSAAM
jgi:CheY-like chemotaxis protein